MADEITARASLAFEKDGTKDSISLGPLTFDVAGKNFLHNRQNVGFAAEEALLLGDITIGGWFCAINRDDTNFVEIRPNTGVADLIRLRPGEFCLFPTAADAVPYLLADTAAVELEYLIVDL